MTLSATDNSLLYHYTSTEGLKGIIQDRALHCSNCLFLNDSTEFYFITQLANNYIRALPREELSKSQSSCLDRILNVSEQTFLKPDNEAAPYITSFSTNGDLLSQWRGYCGNGGYSLGFSRDKLLLSAKDKWDLLPVNYAAPDNTEETPSQIKGMVDSLLQSIKSEIPTLDYDPVWATESLRINFLTITSEEQRDRDKELAKQIRSKEIFLGLDFHIKLIKLSPFFKHLSFAEENEVRLATTFLDDDIDSKVKGSILLPYTAFQWSNDCLEEIIIGPTPNMDQAEFGLTLFLKHQNLESVKIKRSTIDWGRYLDPLGVEVGRF